MANENGTQAVNTGSGLNNRTIRVTPEYLQQKAAALSTNATEVKQLTSQMTESAERLAGRIWSGQARSAYTGKFDSLQAKINEYEPKLQNHAANLMKISDEYGNTEKEARQKAGNLPTDIFSN